MKIEFSNWSIDIFDNMSGCSPRLLWGTFWVPRTCTKSSVTERASLGPCRSYLAGSFGLGIFWISTSISLFQTSFQSIVIGKWWWDFRRFFSEKLASTLNHPFSTLAKTLKITRLLLFEPSDQHLVQSIDISLYLIYCYDQAALDDATEPWGIKVERVEM